MSHTRPAVREKNPASLERELARLRRENQLLRSQLRTKTPIPRSTPRRGAATPGSLAPHEVVAERYHLERLLARGGMGAVWVARDVETGDRVAVKFLQEDAGPEQVARFTREAEVCKRLHSKHVVRVLSHGVDGQNHYLAMELLRGESLSSLLRRAGKLTLPESCALVADIREALAPAHQAGIVHRDLKPQNLFLSVGDDGERVLKLLDFGVAKQIHDSGEMTHSGVIIGSPNYMSPEQAYGVRSVDHRSDLWAVAIILYRVLTGVRPWEGDNALELLLRVCTEPAPPPSSHDASLRPSIDAFFERALAHDPNERFASIDELTAAFTRAARSTSTPPPVAPGMRSPVPSGHGSLFPGLQTAANEGAAPRGPSSKRIAIVCLAVALMAALAVVLATLR